MEHAHCIRMQRVGGDLQCASRHRPLAAVHRKAAQRHSRIVERCGAQHVALATRDVACLRVARTAGLVLPGEVLLPHHAQFAERLAIAHGIGTGIRSTGEIRPVRGRQRVEELAKLRLQAAAHRGQAEWRKRHDEAVELADPVDEPVAAGVADQHVASGTAIGPVLIARMRIRRVVQAASRVEIVVDVDEIVTPAAVDIIAPGAAHQPVVAHIAEDLVFAVATHRAIGYAGDCRTFRLIKIEQEAGNLCERIVFVVLGKFAGGRVVAQHVARVGRLGVELRQSFCSGDRIVARSAVQPVAAQATVDDVIRGVFGHAAELVRGRLPVVILAERRQVHRLLKLAGNIDVGLLDAARRADEGLYRGNGYPVERVGSTVAAGIDAAIVTNDAILPGAAGDPVVAIAADNVVVLAIAEDDVAALHAVDKVVAGFAVYLVGRADIAGRRCTDIDAARCVVEQVGNAHDDAHAAAILETAALVVAKLQEAVRVGVLARRAIGTYDAIDVAVVADYHVRVARMSCRCRGDDMRGRILGRISYIVARDVGPGPAEDQIRPIRAPVWRVETEQVGTAAQDVVLAEVAEDDIIAAVAFDVVVAIAGGFDRCAHQQVAGRIAAGTYRRYIDRAIALDDIVAQLAEDLIVVGTTGNVIVAEVAQARSLCRQIMVQDLNVKVLPDRCTARDVARAAADQHISGAARCHAVKLPADQGTVARIGHAVTHCPVEPDIVAKDQVAFAATVDAIAESAADQHIFAALTADGISAADLICECIDDIQRR